MLYSWLTLNLWLHHPRGIHYLIMIQKSLSRISVLQESVRKLLPLFWKHELSLARFFDEIVIINANSLRRNKQDDVTRARYTPSHAIYQQYHNSTAEQVTQKGEICKIEA